jgi:hypothetical protein
MSPETLKTIFSIGGAIAEHIWRVIQDGNDEELRRLSDVWPSPIASRLALLAAEEKARRAVGGK